MAVKAGEAFVELGIRSNIDKGLKKAQSTLKKTGRSISTIGASITGGATALLAVPVALGSQMQETMSKFNVVFGESAGEMEKWSKTTATALGTSEQAMAGMLSSAQDLLVPMGVVPDEAQNMSKAVSTLAVDLGSFNNMATDKVFDDLTAALTGSGEVMKKYGVILSAAAVNQELLNKGLNPKEASEAEKAQARLAIIMRGTTAAQGDAIRTSDSFANQMKRIVATGKDVAAIIGGTVIQSLAGMLQWINSGAAWIKQFVSENSAMVGVIGKVVIVLGIAGTVLTSLGVALSVAGVAVGGLTSAIGVLGAVISAVFSPFALIVVAVTGAVVALGAAIYGVVKQTGLFGVVFEQAKMILLDFWNIAKTVFGGISDAIAGGDWALAARIAWAGIKTAFWAGLGNIWSATKAIVPKIWETIKSFFARAVNLAKSAISTIVSVIKNPFKASQRIAEFFQSGALSGGFEGGLSGMVGRQRDKAEQELNDLVAMAKEKRGDVNEALAGDEGDAAGAVMPKIEVPEIPTVEIPDIEVPTVDIPKIEVPEIDISDANITPPTTDDVSAYTSGDTGAASQTATDTRGTFSGFAAGLISAGDPITRVAKATEDTAESSRQIAKQTKTLQSRYA